MDEPGPASPTPDADLQTLARGLEAMGCPPSKCLEMAAQLDKRAHQLSREQSRSYQEALTHLLGLMRQGWAAQERFPGT